MDEQLAAAAAPGPGSSAKEPAALPRTWEEMFPRRPAPEGVPYGFLSGRGEPVASSRETLIHLARTRSLPPLVWTPETGGMVPSWEVPFLLEAVRDKMVAEAGRERRMVGVGWAVMALLLAVLLPPRIALLGGALTAAAALVLFVMITRRMEQAERLGPDAFKRGFDALVEERVEYSQPIPATRAVAKAIAAAGVSQLLLLSVSVDVGAVSRDAVAAGEWWRLFTAPVLHGGILHFWMNYAALESLGRTMETRGARAYVPLVFIGAALAGGVCSVMVPPDNPSVGASGGLMGMFGFLAVMAYRRKKHLPQGFLRGLAINIAIIALVGLIAYRFIDNAAHAGGLLAGLLIGVVAVPRGETGWGETQAIRKAAGVAQIVIFASAALAIVLTLLRALA